MGLSTWAAKLNDIASAKGRLSGEMIPLENNIASAKGRLNGEMVPLLKNIAQAKQRIGLGGAQFANKGGPVVKPIANKGYRRIK